jgi:hypothetical protein
MDRARGAFEGGRYCQAAQALSVGHETRPEVGLVYMVTGVDENGDTHIFVTSDLARAEARHREVLAQLTDVRANWLDD